MTCASMVRLVLEGEEDEMPILSHASHKPGASAGESGPYDVQSFKVIAGVDAMLLQTGFILADDMDVPVIDADGVQIVRDGMGALQGWCEKV